MRSNLRIFLLKQSTNIPGMSILALPCFEKMPFQPIDLSQRICRHILPVILLNFPFICPAFGQQDGLSEEKTDTSRILIPEIVIIAQRSKTEMIDRPEAITTLNNQDIRLGTATSTPDALSVMPGVWMQQTNLGGGSPFIRGLPLRLPRRSRGAARQQPRPGRERRQCHRGG